MTTLTPIPSDLKDRDPSTWTDEDWDLFSKVMFTVSSPPDTTDKEFTIGSWWYLRPGAGKLYLAQVKYIDKPFAILHSGDNRIFIANFTGRVWIA